MVSAFWTVFTERGIWDHASVRRQHVSTKGDEIAVSGLAKESRALAPEPHVTFERAVSDLLLAQTHVSILSWKPGPRFHRES